MRTWIERLVPPILGVTLCVSLWASAPLRQRSFNSDLLYVEALYRDIVGPYSLSGWSLTPASYIVPDIFMYSSLRLALGELGYAMTGYGIAWASLMFMMCLLLGRRLGVSPSWAATLWAMMVLPLTVPGWYRLASQVLWPGFHGGACLLLATLLLWVLKTDFSLPSTPRSFVASTALVGLGVTSDPLFWTQGWLPAVAVMAWAASPSPREWSWRQGAHVAALASAPLLFSMAMRVVMWLFGVVTPPGLSLRHWHERVLSHEHYAQVVGAFVDIVALAPASSALGALGALGSAYVAWRGEGTHRRFAQTLCLVALGTVSFPIATTNFYDVHGWRYLLPLFVIMPLGLFVLAAQYRERVSARGIIVCTAILCALALVSTYENLYRVDASKQLRWSSPYPDSIACIDALAQRHGLTHGVGDYWAAKQTTLLSRRAGLHVHAFTGELEPKHWISNANWYRLPSGEPIAPGFVLVRKGSTDDLGERGPGPAKLLERYGPPELRLECEKYSVWLYQSGQLDGFAEVSIRALLGTRQTP